MEESIFIFSWFLPVVVRYPTGTVRVFLYEVEAQIEKARLLAHTSRTASIVPGYSSTGGVSSKMRQPLTPAPLATNMGGVKAGV
jgi:hypothetical protein